MNKKTTLLMFACFLFFLGHDVFAVPAVPWPVDKTQPDGTKITVYIRGDEKVHWMESLDGYTLMYDAEKYIVYAEQDAGKNMVPSNKKFTKISTPPSGIAKGLFYSEEQVRMMEQIWEMVEDDTPQRASPKGSRKGLCILMGFSNRPFSKSTDELETLFNQVGLYPGDNSSKGSVRDFFNENSYGELDFTITIAGPYNVPNTTSYYATREQTFAALAINAAFNDGVDLMEFANEEVNGYGTHTLESFHILFAGYGDENIDNGQQIWSHKWNLSPTITLGDVRISTYSCSPELRGASGNNTTYIGVICHELTHTFGSPDYYDTNNATGGQYTGSGNWDLMANGSWNDSGRQPGHINMFQKTLFDWVTPTELTSYTEVTGMPASAMNPVAYKILANDNGEHYLLENRQQTGFDNSLPGHGLLIWHIHQSALNGNGSNATHPQQVYPVVASSSYQIPNATASTYGTISSSGTPFPGTSGKQSFTSKTTPAMFTWVNSQPIAKPLTEITETGDLISFKFMDGPTTPVTNLTATELSGNVTLDWTAANHPDVIGYKVYRDGVLIYTINNAAIVTYTQIGVTNGTYTYGVSAFYEFTESAPATDMITVSSGSDDYSLPPLDLTGRTSLDKAFLNWNRPFNGGWMTIAGTYYAAYYFEEPTTYFAGTYYGPEQLKGMDGYEITQIRFRRVDTNTASTNRLQIWEVNAGVPGLVVDQLYTGTMTAGEKTVLLTSPYPIDATKEYIIGVQIVDRAVTTGSLAVDVGPIVPGRNYIFEDGYWDLFEDVGLNYNFWTAVYLSSGNPSPPNPDVILDSGVAGKAISILDNTHKRSSALSLHKTVIEVPEDNISYAAPAVVKYHVYRDGVEIGDTTTPSYEDSGLTSGTSYAYCVSAEYANGNTSEGVCIELTTLSPVNPFNPPENLVAKAAGEDITLTWEAPFTGGEKTYVTSTAAPSMTTVNNNAVLTEAIRFDYNDMKRMEGYELTKVTFRQGNSTVGRTYRIKIWSGGNGSTPGTILYDEPATFVNNATTTITLNAPVPINIYEDMWVGVEITRTESSGNNISPRYTSGGVNGKSNLYHNGSTWSTVNNAIWPITVTIEPTSSVSPLTGFAISRNGINIDNVNATTLSYLDQGLTPGEYNYCVTAEYGANQSDPVCVSATAEMPPNPYKSAENLTASLDLNNVTLNWEPPFTSGIIGYSSGVITGGYGLSDDVYMAARFTKDDLKKMLGMQLTKITFASHTNPAANFTPANVAVTLCVWTGGNINGPEALVYTQAVPSYVSGWNTIDLATPIDINVYEELWIGIRTEKLNSNTIYPGTYSAGTADIDIGKGDMIYTNGLWQSWSEYVGTNVNWTLFGHVQLNGSPSPPMILSHIPYSSTNNGPFDTSSFQVTQGSRANSEIGESAYQFNFLEMNQVPVYATPDSYLITRNGAPLATVPSTVLTYTDPGLTDTDIYTYCVTAQYNSGANLSDPVCIDVPFTSECDAKPENLIATLTDNKVELDWDFTPIVAYELLSEDFSSGIPATWLNIDSDGDEQKWLANLTGTGADGNPGFVQSASWNGVALNPDNWLITPAIIVPENGQLNFYVMPFSTYSLEHYGVFISTTGNAIGDFEPIPLFEETLTMPTTWKKREIDLSAYEGEIVYIAFRHYDSSDNERLHLDDVSISGILPEPVFNIYENGTLIDQVTTGTHYEKYLSDGGTYEYCVTFKGLYCESEPACAPAIGPKVLDFTWVGTEDSDWDNEENWLAKQRPTAATDIAFILGDVPHFPDLTGHAPVTIGEIHFAPGAQLGGQSNLTAKAFVGYDLSKRDCWNMLSIPLGQVVPADFAFGGYPTVWVRTFKTTNSGESSLSIGEWVTAAGGSVEFSTGDGFVLWLNSDGITNDDPDKGLKLLGNVLELPYFQNFEESSEDYDYYNSVNLAHSYESGTGPGIGTSTFYNFQLIGGEYTRIAEQNYPVYRNSTAFEIAKGNVSKTPVFADGYFALMGNPFMATLDFDEFSGDPANASTIKGIYHVWVDDGYESYSAELGVAFGKIGPIPLTKDIAPLQGFIVEKNDEAPSPVSQFRYAELPPELTFNDSWAKVNTEAVLRATPVAINRLDIVARNPVAGVRTLIVMSEDGQVEFGNLDARKLMNEINDVPEIYTLKPYQGGSVAVAVNVINSDDLLIPLGLATSYKGDITFTFNGMNGFNDALSLIDAEANRTIDLTGLTSYEYTFNYTPKTLNKGDAEVCEDRFFIRISKSATGLMETLAGKVNVFESNGLIRILSGAANPIKEVAVYDLQGVLIYKEAALNTISHTVDRNFPTGAYIVKVVSEKNTDNVKVVKR